MKLYQQKHRFLSMLLVFVMLMTFVPMDALANTGTTLKGAIETVEVDSNAITGRENNL